MIAAILAVLLTAGTAAAQEDPDWPREFTAPGGAEIVVYQPQIDALEGHKLSGRAAVSVQLADAKAPVFGAVWYEARIDTDRDTRTVSILGLKVPRVRFADATEEQEGKLASLLEREVPTWDLEISLDKVLTALGAAETRHQAAEGLNNEPPEVLFRTAPTILVTVDGDPKLIDVGDSGYQYVANSPFVILYHPQKVNFYLYASKDTWYAARNVRGPWVVLPTVPKEIAALIPPEVDQQMADDAGEAPTAEPPAIVARTRPAELIVSLGSPQYKPVAGGELLYMSNTESDVLMEIATQRQFVLLSGRWYAGPGLEGPWEFVAADALPSSFQAIETDSEVAHLRSFVAGTVEAEEAVLDAQIPQTAAIKRDTTIQVEYDGAPKFEPITGTNLEYAINTPGQVLKVEGRYYAVESGVWYVADNPGGPWAVATQVPQAIYEQPPSSPTYNTRYVYIYDSTPTVVYTGYYPGYMYSYPYHGCMVYGTGYYYQPWYGSYYYPRHATYGFHVSWSSYSGWSMGFSWSSGPFTFGMSWGGYGGYRGGYYPPGGFYGYGAAYNRGLYEGARAGYRAGYRQGRIDQARANNHNLYNQGANRNRVAAAQRPAAAKRPAASGTRLNNVYADRDGNVYRRNQDGNWQQRDGTGRWTRSDLGSTRSGRDDGLSRSPSRSGGRGGLSAGSRSGGSLQQDYSARQRGSMRTQSYRGSRGFSGGRRR